MGERGGHTGAVQAANLLGDGKDGCRVTQTMAAGR